MTRRSVKGTAVWRTDRRATVLVLGALIVVATGGVSVDAQQIRPGETVRPDETVRTDETMQPRDGGVSPEEIPDAFRSRFFRSPGEEIPVPDVLVLTNGRKIEAYFLQAYAGRLVFYVKENARSFVREEIPRSMVAAVHYEQYLERDATEPRLVRRARKQPVPKKNVLAGRYRGVQDRFTTWTATFHSETNKPLPYAEDATEYGTFVIESKRRMPSGYANTTWNMGRYSLFAPSTVNNDEWVLELTEVVHTERDRTDHLSWFSGSVQDDVLIVQFSPRGGFRVHWSNLSTGAWTTLPQVEFQPVSGSGAGAAPGSRQAPSRIHRVPSSSAPPPVRLVGASSAEALDAIPPRSTTQRVSLAVADGSGGESTTGRESTARAWVLEAGRATPDPAPRRAFLANRSRRPIGRIGDWGPPNSLWDR